MAVCKRWGCKNAIPEDRTRYCCPEHAKAGQRQRYRARPARKAALVRYAHPHYREWRAAVDHDRHLIVAASDKAQTQARVLIEQAGLAALVNGRVLAVAVPLDAADARRIFAAPEPQVTI